MKQNFKIFLIALIIGMSVAFFISYKFDPAIISKAIDSKITLFYVGSYNSLDNANAKLQNYKNAMIYSDNGIYYIVIGAYHDSQTMELMESYFLDKDISFRKKECKVTTKFLNDIQNYELLITTSSNNYYADINGNLLNLFYEYINS